MLNLVAETIRRSYENEDRLIANVKKIFVKAPLRVEVYKERVKEVPLPPEPVLTRWRTWFEAAVFYSKYFEPIKDVSKLKSKNHNIYLLQINFTDRCYLIQNVHKPSKKPKIC
jgi:hypothetical protein